MNKSQAIEITRKYIESQFPRTCYNCRRTYRSLSEYLIKTKHLDDPILYDEHERRVEHQNPTGVVSYANCACGSTLAITSQKMDLITYWRLMLWAKREARKQKISISELLRQLRKEIDRQVLDKNESMPE